jgi:hypothetical protein
MSLDDVEVQFADDDDVIAAVQLVLDDCDMTIQELRTEALAGRFSSEKARLGWWSISPYLED